MIAPPRILFWWWRTEKTCDAPRAHGLARVLLSARATTLPAMAVCRFATGFADASFRLFELDESTLAEVLRDDSRCVYARVLRRT